MLAWTFWRKSSLFLTSFDKSLRHRNPTLNKHQEVIKHQASKNQHKRGQSFKTFNLTSCNTNQVSFNISSSTHSTLLSHVDALAKIILTKKTRQCKASSHLPSASFPERVFQGVKNQTHGTFRDPELR